MKPLLFESFGGPEVLQYRDLPDPAVPPVHVQLAMRAIGVNFGDLHRWRGVLPSWRATTHQWL